MANRITLVDGSFNAIGTSGNPLIVNISGSSGDIVMADGVWIGLSATAGRLVFNDATPDLLDFQDCRIAVTQAGTSGAISNFITLTNEVATVANGGSGIAWYLRASDGNDYDAGLISVASDASTWTATGTSQDSFMDLYACLNGTVEAKFRIKSTTGSRLEFSSDPGSYIEHDGTSMKFRNNTAGNNYWQVGAGGNFSIDDGSTPMVTLNAGTGLSLALTGTTGTVKDEFIIRNKFAGGSGTGAAIRFDLTEAAGAVVDSGLISVLSENAMTITAATQDTQMLFATSLNGTLATKLWLTSEGYFGVGADPGGYDFWVTGKAKIENTGATSGSHALVLKGVGLGVVQIALEDDSGEVCGSWQASTSSSAISSVYTQTYLSSGANINFQALTSVRIFNNSITTFTATGLNLVGIGTEVPSAKLDVEQAGTVTATTDLLELTNSGNAASMTSTGTGILFNQWAYDASTPAVTDSGRISVLTEGNWTTADANTQDSKMSFQTALNGTVAEKAYIASSGAFWVVSAGDSYFTLGQDATHYSQFIHRDADDTLDLIVTSPASASTVFTLTQHGGVIYPPTAVQTIVAATGITAAMLSRNVLVQGSAGNIDITANPQIAAGAHGQIVTFIGQHNTNTVQFDTGTGLTLEGGASCTLGLGDTLTLIMDTGLSLWCEQSRSNNN